MKKVLGTLALASAATFAFATPVFAAGISIFNAPGLYQQSGTNPCIFYANTSCPQQPANFPVVADTQSDPANLTSVFTGTALTAFTTAIPGTPDAFIIGYDVNQAGGTVQTFAGFTISFFSDAAGTNPLGTQYAWAGGSIGVPFTVQGNGFTDYVLTAGCSGIQTGTGLTVPSTCTAFTPFVVPVGTLNITITFNQTGSNDGGETIFLIPAGAPPCTPTSCPPLPQVPEPGTLLMLGSGLALAAAKLRRRKA